MLLALEFSFTIPPFGLLPFVMNGVSPPDTTMREIYLAAMPYIACSLLLVGLLMALSGIALWLPYLANSLTTKSFSKIDGINQHSSLFSKHET
jgi:TRAP-type mannitol/chloroaromatic compound transport system permease large subunit